MFAFFKRHCERKLQQEILWIQTRYNMYTTVLTGQKIDISTLDKMSKMKADLAVLQDKLTHLREEKQHAETY